MISLADSNFYYLSFFMNTGPEASTTASIEWGEARGPKTKPEGEQ